MRLESSSTLAEAAHAGWQVMTNFVLQDEAHTLHDSLRDLMASPSKNKNSLYYYDLSLQGERRLTRIEHIWEALPVLCDGKLGERIREGAEQYLGGPVVLFKDKLNVRYAGSAGYAPHQDSAAGWTEFADHFVSIGLFLGPSDPHHGGFEVVSDAHRRGRFSNDKGRMSDADFEALGPHAVHADLGDAILLDSETPHRTLKNESNLDSLHLLFTFATARAGAIRDTYYSKKSASFSEGRRDNCFDFRVFAF